MTAHSIDQNNFLLENQPLKLICILATKNPEPQNQCNILSYSAMGISKLSCSAMAMLFFRVHYLCQPQITVQLCDSTMHKVNKGTLCPWLTLKEIHLHVGMKDQRFVHIRGLVFQQHENIILISLFSMQVLHYACLLRNKSH